MSQLWQLYRLGKFDCEIREKKKEKDKLVNPDGLKEECSRLENEIPVAEEQKSQLHLKIKKLELETDSVENHRKLLEKKIYSGKTTNPKELQNWQVEIENLKIKQNQKEEMILELMEQMESLNKQIDEQKRLLEERGIQIENARENYKNDLDRIERESAELLEKRGKIADSLDENSLRKYEQLRRIKEDGMAVARIEGDVCGGCYMNIPDSMIKQVQAHHLITCHNCMRILYWEEEKKSPN